MNKKEILKGGKATIGGVSIFDEKAQIRDYYYSEEAEEVRRILRKDLALYYDSQDLGKIRPITLDFFVKGFMQRLCNVYDYAPVITFDGGVPEKTEDKFRELLQEVRINNFLDENFMRMRLHNTVVANVRYHSGLNKIYLQSWHAGNMGIYSVPGFVYEPEILYYFTGYEDNIPVFAVWDRESKEHYYWLGDISLEDIKKYRGKWHKDKLPIPGNDDYKAPDYNPFVVYRYKADNKFWGSGMDSIIELVRTINVLFTVCNDDTVQETMRLLILNFEPAGTDGERGQIKAGMRHPIMSRGGIPGESEKPDGKIISADLFNDEVISLIQALTEIISSTYGIESVLKTTLIEHLSGVAIRLRNEPILKQWSKDKEILSYYDRDLIKALVNVHNYHRSDRKIDPGIIDKMTVHYRDPQLMMITKDDLELAEIEWKYGISSPVDYLIHRNPAMTREEALERIIRNTGEYKKIVQSGKVNGLMNLSGE